MSPLGHSTTRTDDDPIAAAAKYDHHISLIDHTQTEEEQPPEPSEQPSDGEEASPQSPRSSENYLSYRGAKGALREELARRKYARWQEDKVPQDKQSGRASDDSLQKKSTRVGTSERAVEGSSDEGYVAYGLSKTKSGLDKGRQAVKNVIRPKRTQTAIEGDMAVDVLYENQRGLFLFGVPRFSPNALYNFDPANWTTVDWKPSGVNITNAQVPDPGWVWDWKSWYVDMSGDVDEEGWQYSLAFRTGFAWHGTHPWFHSFVRRRRWLRKRVRKDRKRNGLNDDKMRQAHMLNQDYFTIHTKRTAGDESTRAASYMKSLPSHQMKTHEENEDGVDDEEVGDLPTLFRRLKNAAIDREKIVVIRKFLDQGGDDLYYLADHMNDIMSQLIFQNSKRQLLAILMRKADAANDHRQEHKYRVQEEDETERKRIDYLMTAVQAAEAHVKQLEYWSDIRGMVREGDTLYAVDEDQGWGHQWQGVDTSGPGVEEQAPDDIPIEGDNLAGDGRDMENSEEASVPATKNTSKDNSEETWRTAESAQTADTDHSILDIPGHDHADDEPGKHDNNKYRQEDKEGTPQDKGKAKIEVG